MTKKRSIRDFLENVPKEIKQKIYRSYEVLGDIAIIEINKETEKYEKEIAKAIFKLNKRIKSVFKKTGIHQGEFRTLPIKYIAGEKKDWTIYKENGIQLYLEPGKVYFSQRLSTERKEILTDLNNKKILIMFSGAGPYSFVAYRKNHEIQNITSVEINPCGTKFSKKSIELNKSIGKKTKLYATLLKTITKINNKQTNKIKIDYKKILNYTNYYKLQFINADIKKFIKELLEETELKNEEKNENIKNKNHHNNKLDEIGEILLKTNLKIQILKTNSFEKKNKTLKPILKKEILLKNLVTELKTIKKEKLENIIPYLILNIPNIQLKLIQKTEKQTTKQITLKSETTKIYFIEWLKKWIKEQNINSKKLTLKEIIKDITTFDKIYMPLPKDAHTFLDQAFKISHNGTEIYMYDFVKEEEIPNSTIKKIETEAIKQNIKIKIEQIRKVGQYSPKKYRICAKFTILEIN